MKILYFAKIKEIIGKNEDFININEQTTINDIVEKLKLIEEAHKAGADAIKLQTYTQDTMTIDCSNSYFILNFLLQGKNCAYCSCDMFIHEGDMVRDDYVRNVSKQLEHIKY